MANSWGCIFGFDNVFPLAFYHGNSKPSSVNNFLDDFIQEVLQLKSEGIEVNNQLVPFNLKAIVCDAPARSFVKCIIGHTGYYSCERCEAKGISIQHRITFDDKDFYSATLRSNDDFSTFKYEGTHQKSLTPLVDIGINLINDFPIDYMHCVLLGVVKRMISFWVKGPKVCRLSNQQIILVSNHLIQLRLPSNFNRQPRGLKDLCYWKATEFRSFFIIYWTHCNFIICYFFTDFFLFFLKFAT